MSVVSMKQLLEAGVHFGHQAKRWNPKMKKYIFTERNGIHVIDLHKSLKKIEEAYEEMRKIAEDGGKILFVGTKKQAQEAIKEQAERSGMYYVNSRWLAAEFRKELSKLSKNLSGIRDMEKAPDAIYVVDVKMEELSVTEAHLLGIPVFAMIDTNVDPDLITHPIPANDDAIRSVKLITSVMANAIVEGNQGKENVEPESEAVNVEEGSAE